MRLQMGSKETYRGFVNSKPYKERLNSYFGQLLYDVARQKSKYIPFLKEKPKGYRYYELKILSDVYKIWREDYKAFLNSPEHISYISEMFKVYIQNPKDRTIPYDTLQAYHGFVRINLMSEFKKDISSDPDIEEYVKRIYADEKSIRENEILNTIKSAGYKVNHDAIVKQGDSYYDFDEPDYDALDVLLQDFYYWIGETYDTALADEINEIAYDVLNSGLSQNELADEFNNRLGKKYASLGRGYFTILASNVANTSRNFGALRTYYEYDIRDYEFLAILDRRTTEICRSMDGKTFHVETAIAVVKELYMAMSPDDVKAIKPFLSWDDDEEAPYFIRDGERIYLPMGNSVNDNDMIARWGCSIPPLHYLCRSTIIISKDTVLRSVDTIIAKMNSKFNLEII